MSSSPFRIGLVGLGTVGQGVVDIIQKNGEMLAARTGRRFEIVAVNARSRNKNRDVDISAYEWMDDAVAMARRDDIDVIIELVGGENGTAKAVVQAALETGKSVVTANKALIAKHGHALAQLAESQGKALRYEAAVAGGIPIIKSLGEGFAGNAISRVSGIMNGTTNYMLTRMEHEKISYEDVFDAANQLGYLEADPSLDVGGIDAAHKLAILAALGFGQKIDFDAISITGIENVSLEDIELAGKLGYRIRLICSAEKTDNGVMQSVAPTLVSTKTALGQCEGVTNMIVVEGDAVGTCVLEGPGAGRGATASAVLADLTDIARGFLMPTFGVPADQLADASKGAKTAPSAYYVRMQLSDTVGVLADVTAALARAGVSIDQMRQLDHQGDETPLVLITHHIDRTSLDMALREINELDAVLREPVALRIQESKF